MSKLIKASINLSKIAKSTLFESKSGEKWLNLSIWLNDTPDQYGNDVSIQQQTAQGEPKIYLGNGKYYKKEDGKKDDLAF
jgi:hypothetical protein